MSVVEVLGKAVAADEVAGCALIDSVVYDFVADLADVNRDAIRAEMGIWALDRVQVAKRALGRSYVDTVSKGSYPGDDVHLAAEWLAGIESFVVAAASGEVSKAGWEDWRIGGKQKKRMVSRDASGRFTRGVNQNTNGRSIGVGDTESMSPALRRHTDKVSWSGGVDDKKAAFHQGQYEEATRHAIEFKRAFRGNDKNVDAVLMLQDPDGNIRMVHVPMDKVHEGGDGKKPSMDVNSLRADDRILGVEVAPGKGATAQQASRVAEFNLLGGAGGSKLAGLAMTDTTLRNNLKSSLKMPNAREDTSALSRVFGVLSAGGAVLAGVTGSEKLSQMSALVGEMGPQAEEVLGPYVKRSAYRYRGTEKTPDAAFRNPLSQLNEVQVRDVKSAWPSSSKESLAMHATADVASGHLAETLQRDPIVRRLSERAGRILPSQGVIYDREGKVVSQSVGYSDDHYLPFDLMNIGRLRGGQYVRTRQEGGMTGEDVYATVMSGARQAQVVSGSGVFTLEMSPDFRGARAMSDKARGMYDAYLKILDAVDDSGLYLVDITPKEKATLRAEAAKEMGPNADKKDVAAAGERKILAARENSRTVTGEDEEAAAYIALKEAGGQVRSGETAVEAGAKLTSREGRIFADSYKEQIREVRNRKANELRLNGQGYAIALETLRQQFPYFIKDVTYRKLEDLPTDRPRMIPGTREFATDRGYAQPGSLRARNVRTGFYNPGDIEPGSKTQRDDGRPAVERKASPKGPEGGKTQAEPSEPEDAPEKKKAPSTGAQGEIDASLVLKPAMAKSLEQLLDGFSSVQMDKRMPLTMSMDPDVIPADPMQSVLWLIASGQGNKSVKEKFLAAPAKDQQRIVEALGDDEVVFNALTTLLTADGAADPEEFFASGGNIGGEKNIDRATDWIAGTAGRGVVLGDFVAMNSGFKEMPSSPAAVIGHRGLMPLQMPEAAGISTQDQFRAFVADPANSAMVATAEGISYDANDMRSISQMSEHVGNRLDAIEELRTAQKDARALQASNVDIKDADLMLSSTFADAMGTVDEGAAPSSVEVMGVDPDALARSVQSGWSLAVTSRVLDSLKGGSSWDLKEGDRLLEPVEKAGKRRRRKLDWKWLQP